MSTPVTRFAPSPTGFLHIGGGRTALFNWLYARKTGSKMLLRIEDTDRERSTETAIKEIIDGLAWLGLKWDGEVIYQFARAPRHAEVAAELLAKGAAYHCYASADELTEMRETARKEGRPPRYDGRWRDAAPEKVEAAIAEGRKPVVRLKAPQTGETVIEDAVQGRVVFPNKDLDDLVLLRSDGNPTYMLAVVVDDHDIRLVELVGAPVERQHFLARLGASDHEIARDLLRVEHMQRPRAVVGDQVGDVDQGANRAQADGGQLALQPIH